jgi:hypothetical protein
MISRARGQAQIRIAKCQWWVSEHESNERKPPPRKPLVSRILCAFRCQYHRFTRPSKNGETENQKNERMMARWTAALASDQNEIQ